MGSAQGATVLPRIPTSSSIFPTGENGDTYDRYMVRMEEMRQSLRIIDQAVESIPEGPIMAKLPKIIKPPVGRDLSLD